MGEADTQISTDVPDLPEDKVQAFGMDGLLSPEVRDKAAKPEDIAAAQPEDADSPTDTPVDSASVDEPIPTDSAPPAEQPAAPDDAIPGDEQALLEAAKRWGVPEAEARQVGSPEAVQALATMSDRRAMEMLQAFQAQQGGAQAPQQPQPQAAPVEPVPAVPQAPEAPAQDDGLQVYRDVIANPEEHTPLEVQQAKDWLAYRQQQSQQAQSAYRVQQQSAEAERQQAMVEIDQLVNKLGPDWSEFLGTAKTSDLAAHNQHSFEFQRRVALDQAIVQIRQLNPDLPLDAVHNRAVALAFADQFREVEQRRVAAQAKNRNSQLLQRPAGRSEGTPRGLTPEQETQAILSQEFKKIQQGNI